MGQCFSLDTDPTPKATVSFTRAARNGSTRDKEKLRGNDPEVYDQALCAALLLEKQRRQLKSASTSDPLRKKQAAMTASRRSSSVRSLTEQPLAHSHSHRLVNQCWSLDTDATRKGAVSVTRARNLSTREKAKPRDESKVYEQALSAALRLERQRRQLKSASTSDPERKKQVSVAARRSSSALRPLKEQPLVHPHHLVISQDVEHDGMEKYHLVLVHGGGFGPWCWYKTIALLQESGCRVTAMDLTGSGVQSLETNNIISLSQYVKPLTNFLENLADDEKVILVGHDFGGTCLSYAMELFPHKISKAIFVAATMLIAEQSTLDIFSQMVDSNDLMRQAQIFLYANGNTNSPTAIDFEKTLLKDLLFNKSSSKDVALASVSMRPMPFAPVSEKLSLTPKNHGSVRRFYIETSEDNVIPITFQENMVKESPPEQVFRIKGADHSPFFSKPQTLHNFLLEIIKIQ